MVHTFALVLLLLAGGQNLFNNPESVVYDERYNRYLVSNCGDGKIIQLKCIQTNEGPGTPEPVYKFFNTDLTYALGLHIRDGVLYVASTHDVVAFDLATAEELFRITISESQLLNDIVTDADGFLYVSDSEAFKIFKVNLQDKTYSVFVDSGVHECNGMLYDEANNRLIVCTSKFNAPIYGVALSDGTVTMIIKTNLTYLDGLAFDRYGYIYVSSWWTHSVYRFNPDFSNIPVKVSKGHSGPADICYGKVDNVIAVPNFNANRVDFVKIKHASTPDTGASKKKR